MHFSMLNITGQIIESDITDEKNEDSPEYEVMLIKILLEFYTKSANYERKGEILRNCLMKSMLL